MAEPVPPAVSTMLVVLRVALRPVGVTVSDNFTVPANPLRLERVRVEGLMEPRERERELGLAETLKPVMVTGTITEWLMAPLAARTVTV